MNEKSSLPSFWNRDEGRFDPFRDLHQEVNRLFSEFGRGLHAPALQAGNGGQLVPHIDVAETDEMFEVTAELPSVDEKDIGVTLDEDMLTITGEKKSESEEQDKQRHLIERSYGMFRRTINLPANIRPDKVAAKFDKGVLTVLLPKAPETKPKTRKIKVRAAT